MAQLLLPTFLLLLLLHSPIAAGNPLLVAVLTRVAARLIIKEGTKIAARKFIQEVKSNPNQDGSTSASGLQARLRWSNDDLEYVADLTIGTPARNVSLIIDTTDSFVAVDCEPCAGCFQQRATPLAYYSGQSSTFSTIPCNSPLCQQISDFETCTSSCQYTTSWIQGLLANDTFGFLQEGGSTSDHPSTITFGCNKLDNFDLSDSSGFAGFGRGPLSLISQLPYSKFSYCFPNAFNESVSSYMFFGSYAELDSSIAVSTTSFVQNNDNYYLDLRGISVGGTLLPIPVATFEYVQGRNGTIIDSTSPVTFLVQEAYDAVREAFISQLDLPVREQYNVYGLDLCFDVPSGRADSTLVPPMTFHFAGADMSLPVRNYLIRNDDTTVVCLTMMPSDEGISTLGNLQQQNLQFIYDLQNETLSFRSIQCDQLQPHESNGAVKLYLTATPFFALLIAYINMFLF